MINTLYNSECIEFMRTLQDNFVDLTVTSPPYDDLRNYKGYSFDFENVAKELFRITKDGGVVVWVVSDATVEGSESGTSFRQALYFKDIGFKLHDTMIYKRPSFYPYPNRYYQEFEYMFVLTKNRVKTCNRIKDVKTTQEGKSYKSRTERDKDGNMIPTHSPNAIVDAYKYRGNIWHYNAGYNLSTKDDYAFDHPAIMPERLAEDHIITWSNEGDLVFEPFCGSGTVPKMAILNKRNFIACEISAEYCEIAKRRILEAQMKQSTKLF